MGMGMGMGISELIANVIARVPTDNTKMVSFAPEKLKKSEKKKKTDPSICFGNRRLSGQSPHLPFQSPADVPEMRYSAVRSQPGQPSADTVCRKYAANTHPSCMHPTLL
jgi:hypothetical protein